MLTNVKRADWPTDDMLPAGAAPRFRARLRYVSSLALAGTVLMHGPWRLAARVWDSLAVDVQIAVLVLAWMAGIGLAVRALFRQMFSPLDPGS